MIKLLTVIFSYNRFYLLKNTVESFYTFGPESDLLLYDDGSDDHRIQEYLQLCRRKKNTKIIINPSHTVEFHGGLYNNMNRAVEFALHGEYTHIFFVQDDMQFMWKDHEFLARVERIFALCSDAAMVSLFFQKRISLHKAIHRFEEIVVGEAWHLKPYGICDVGIMPLSLFQKENWKFGGSEGENGRQWRERGYKLYVLSAPIVAWIPWPQVRKYSHVFGGERIPVNRFFLKPLSLVQIKQLGALGTSRIPCHEDFCFPWGWSCLSPYWFTNVHSEYVTLIVQSLFKDLRMFPHRVKA